MYERIREKKAKAKLKYVHVARDKIFSVYIKILKSKVTHLMLNLNRKYQSKSMDSFSLKKEIDMSQLCQMKGLNSVTVWYEHLSGPVCGLQKLFSIKTNFLSLEKGLIPYLESEMYTMNLIRLVVSESKLCQILTQFS